MVEQKNVKVMNNKEFAEKDEYFGKCCEVIPVAKTKRQASRYRNEKGLAYKIGRNKAKEQIEKEKEMKAKAEIKEGSK